MIIDSDKTKYDISISSRFKHDFKKILKQGKDISKLIFVLEKLANGEQLESKYKDHSLFDNRLYKGSRECHIEPDWLLVYRICNDELELLLLSTGSHSEILK